MVCTRPERKRIPEVLVVPFFLWSELIPLDRVPVYTDILVLVTMSQTHPSVSTSLGIICDKGEN